MKTKKTISIISIIVVLIFVLTACGKQESTKPSKDEVQWVLTHEQKVRYDNEANPVVERECFYEYDSTGKLINEELTLDSTGTTFTSTVFKYDEDGNVISKSGTQDDYFSGESSYTYNYTYDKNGNCSRVFIDWGTSTDDITYKYDELGGVIEERSVYTYDSKTYTTINSNTLTYENDLCVQSQIVITSTSDHEENTRYAVNRYTYDENGNKEKEVYYVETEDLDGTEMTISVNGRCYKQSTITYYTYENLKDVAIESQSNETVNDSDTSNVASNDETKSNIAQNSSQSATSSTQVNSTQNSGSSNNTPQNTTNTQNNTNSHSNNSSNQSTQNTFTYKLYYFIEGNIAGIVGFDDGVSNSDIASMKAELGSGVKYIEITGKDNIEVPENINGHTIIAIDGGAFCNCTSISKIKIPSCVTIIEPGAFRGCKSSLIIYGDIGSAAQQYAQENNITFSQK